MSNHEAMLLVLDLDQRLADHFHIDPDCDDEDYELFETDTVDEERDAREAGHVW